MKINPKNPRVIEDKDFHKLVQSVKDDGFMLSIRFLVIDRDNVVMGGNQRLRACQVAGLKEVYAVKAEDLSAEQMKEFVVRDNTYYGQWDQSLLSQQYSSMELVGVGIDLMQIEAPPMETIGDIEPNIDASDLADRKNSYENNEIKQIVTYFPAELYEKVVESLIAIKLHMKCEDNPSALLKLISHWKSNYAR